MSRSPDTATALITGAAGGLGAAVTASFLADGWRVVAPYRSPGAGERIVAAAGDAAAGRIEVVEADLGDASAVARAAEVAGGDQSRPLRAVVNLAGAFAAGGRVHETPIERFESQLEINLRPTYLVCMAAIPLLLDAGGGAIVCTSSRAALRPFPGAAGYIVSKAAVLALVDALAVEYGAEGVRCNAVLPSVIDTPANRAAQPDADRSRWVTTAQLAEVIAFLCSDRAEAVNGAHVPVYGRG